jgi:P-type Ca2+ transporter type 2C
MDWHVQSPKGALKILKSSEEGLSESEVQKRFAEYGKNIIRKLKTHSKFLIFVSQLNSFLVYILLLATLVSVLIGHFLDAGVILAIIILNAIIGFIQEYKAEEIIAKLRRSLAYKVRVVRGGAQEEIDSKFLVPGDIVLLDAGDRVLADCRLLEQENFRVNEAALTGESFPIEKEIDSLEKGTVLAERRNMIYAGTNVVKGKAMAIVVGTGRSTEFGKLAELVQITKDEKMPLEKKIDSFSKKISIAIIGFVALSFVIGISVGIDKIEMFLIAVSLAVGAIPEGLPAIIVITLAVAIKQMHKANTLIRKLPAAETLGRATVICTDKTGTLTEEELTVEKVYCGKMYDMNSTKKGGSDLKQILKIGLLCNDARDEKDEILGDPTEIALIKIAKRFGLKKKEETEKSEKVKEFPFDSSRKMMSIIRKNGKIQTSYVKGAPQFILERCTKELVGGKVKLLNAKRKKELEKVFQEMEAKGLRVLGLAFRQVTNIDQKQAENHLVLSGFQGMIDPPRKEVKEAIREAVDAGIEIKIITGDSALTTKAIADKIGLSGEMINGRELDALPADKWDAIVRTKTIFARTTPEQKLKIVEILKGQKQTVAVTGDGVNDILALKRADIGISMGIRGSDVARDSSDMVLLDDNFASIIGAIRQGRRVFDNLKKSIKFLLAANAADIFIIIFALIIGMPLPFLPLAILWMNLVTDSLPALALAVEPAEEDVMKRKPKSDGLLSGIWQWILVAGALNFISVIFLFGWARAEFGLEIARTMAITAAIFFELFFVFACKSNRSIFKTGILNNQWLLVAFGVSVGLHILAIYSVFGGVFGFVSLTGAQLGISILVSISGLVVFEVWKIIQGIRNIRR